MPHHNGNHTVPFPVHADLPAVKGFRPGTEDVISREPEDDAPFDRRLVAELKGSNQPIGECKLGLPGKDGLSETDVKLLPELWGQGYGTEIKRGLVDYLFRHREDFEQDLKERLFRDNEVEIILYAGQ